MSRQQYSHMARQRNRTTPDRWREMEGRDELDLSKSTQIGKFYKKYGYEWRQKYGQTKENN